MPPVRFCGFPGEPFMFNWLARGEFRVKGGPVMKSRS